MKKLLITTTIIVGTLAGAGLASAGTIYSDSYTGWAADAFSAGGQR